MHESDVQQVGGGNGRGDSVNPSRLDTYLPKVNPFTTETLLAGIPTKLLVPTIQKTVKDFSLDLANERYFFDAPGVTGRWFEVHFTTSITTSASNHVVTLEMYKNGAFEEGVSIERFISGGSDKGALGINGMVQLNDQDYIELYVTDSTGGTVTFSRLAITINELVGAV